VHGHAASLHLHLFTGPGARIGGYAADLQRGEDGRDLLDRAGEQVEMKARRVTVHSLRVSASPREQNDLARRRRDAEVVEQITLSATVSKGTYIRSLARDISHALGTVGHITMLRRTKAGPFTLEQAISLDFLADAAKARTLDGAVLPLEAGLDDIPALPVTPEEAQLLRHGQRLRGNPATPGLYLANDDHRPIALVEVSAGDVIVVRGFNL